MKKLNKQERKQLYICHERIIDCQTRLEAVRDTLIRKGFLIEDLPDASACSLKDALVDSAPPKKSSRVISFDVADAVTGRFICTMKMTYNPLFKLTPEDVLAFIYRKRPTLKYRKIQIELL